LVKRFLIEIADKELAKMKSNAESDNLPDVDFVRLTLSNTTDSHGFPLSFNVKVSEITKEDIEAFEKGDWSEVEAVLVKLFGLKEV